MNNKLYENILKGIDKAVYESLNEAAGTIYNDKWEKFTYALYWYVYESYYYFDLDEFDLPNTLFQKFDIEYPVHKTIRIKIVHDKSYGAAWNASSDVLEIDKSLFEKNKKYEYDIIISTFCTAMIHEFTHAFNMRYVQNLDKYFDTKYFNTVYVEDYYDHNEDDFQKIIKDAMYYFRKTEQNARISECAHQISRYINEYTVLYINNNGKLNIDKLLKTAEITLSTNKMEKFYNAFKDNKLGNYEKYKKAANLINNNICNDMAEDNIYKLRFVYQVNKDLGNIGDIIGIIQWTKKQGYQFMFFKTNSNMFNITSEEDYNRVRDIFLEQTRKEIDNFKKRGHKVIWHCVQKFYDKQYNEMSELKKQRQIKQIKRHIENNKTQFGRIKNTAIELAHKILKKIQKI